MGSWTKTQVINICRASFKGLINSGTKIQMTPIYKDKIYE